MSDIRTIGILTSGGDCAGLNAAIRAVAHAAIIRQGWRALGIFDGTLGLIENPPRYCDLDLDNIDRFPFRSGGTALGTISSGDPFNFPMPDGTMRDRSGEFAAGARALGLDALVVIGGDGSMRILSQLCARANLAMIGIPKTIDNDVPCTDRAIGFSTAVQVVSDAIDRLQPTAASHHRVMVLEVMGRTAGHIALHGGIAGGADVIVLPELGLQLDGVVAHLHRLFDGSRRHALVVIAEGVRHPDASGSIGTWLAGQIRQRSGIEARCTVLGHLQRGGTPNVEDRLLSSAFGTHAIDLLADCSSDRMMSWRNGRIDSVPLAMVVDGPQLVTPDHWLLAVARRLGVYLGDSQQETAH